MSFGFSIGDIITVSTLARSVWGRFRDSSDQFNAIQSEQATPIVAGLYLALDDIANSLSGIKVTDKQAKDLPVLVKGCRDVLNDTDQYIRKNESLGTESSSLGSKTRKAWRRLKWDPATVNELRNRMVANTLYLNAFTNSLASQVSRPTNETVEKIAEDVQSLRLNQNQQDREEILQWISPLNFAPQQSDLSARRQEGTGSWLLESQEFQEWKSTGGSTLVCQGMPGAGKTMLTSLVIDHLRRTPGEKNTATAYIYCDYRRQDEQTPMNLTASVIKQLLEHHVAIPEGILKIYQPHRSKGTRPTFEEVLEMMNLAMSPLSKIFLILDALDELGNAGQVRQDLLERLRLLQGAHRFNLMTTSRYIPSLAQECHQPLCMEIMASPEDIRKYVQGHTADLANCVKKDLVLQKTIADSIVDVVEGMFLLAALHMDSLRDKVSAKMVRKALEILPKGSNALSLAYDGAMQRLENQREGFRLLAKRLLGWLTYSERLMTVKEIQHALAIEPETSDLDEDNLSDIYEIVGFCAGLVIIDEETQIIRLVHYTTQEYFRRNGDRLLASAQQEIAISCLTYLLYDQFGDGWVVGADPKQEPDSEDGPDSEEESNPEEEEDDEEDGKEISVTKGISWPSSRPVADRLQKYPFLNYAATHWPNHVGIGGEQKVKNIMMSFAKDDRRVSSAGQVMLTSDLRPWHELLDYVDGTRARNPLSAMHVLAYQGYKDLIVELLNHGFEADAKDSWQRTPLWWAARQGQYAVVELLLSQSHVNVNNRGLRYNIFGGQYSTATPLGVAASEGKDMVVKLLIEREDVDVKLSDGYGVSPLNSAARKGYSTIVKLLLKRKDIDVNSRDIYGGTPLLSAADFAREDIVRQLLKRKDIHVNSMDKEARSPLTAAACRGHEGVIKMIIGHVEIHVNTRDGYGLTPIMSAVRGQINEAAVKLLLSHTDIKVNYKDNNGKTVLHYAARRCLPSTFKLLISRTDIDVNVKDECGETPLHVAVYWRCKSLVEMLLEHAGIEINAKSNMGRTPLAQAMTNGSAEIVELLCVHPDVDLYPTDKWGRDVFALVEEEQERISTSYKYFDDSYVQEKTPESEDCLQILRTAIEKRSREQSQSSQPEQS